MPEYTLWAVYAVFTQEGREIVRLYEDPVEATEYLEKCRAYKAKEPEAPDYDDIEVVYQKKWNDYCDAHEIWQLNHPHTQWQSADSYEIEPICYIPKKETP